MFVIIAGSQRDDLRHAIQAMASALLGASGKLGIWYDEAKGLAAAGLARGIQAEDSFDTQPYVNEQLCFVADGYVYDRGELGDSLAFGGNQVAAMSDAELLFHAYVRFGEDLPRKVYGDYAFAALHRQSGEVFISDNHVGAKTVYYAERAGALIVSSQVIGMLANPAIQRKPNLVALPLLVAPKMISGASPVEDVHLLPGGHLLHYAPGRAAYLTRWWTPGAVPELRFSKEQEYVQLASEVFERAVGSTLTCVTGVNTTLSGGLDSTLMAAVAARQLHGRGQHLTAYTSVPEEGLKGEEKRNWDHDESHLARALVERNANMDLVLIRPGGRCYLDVMPEIHETSCTAVRNTSNQLWGLRMAELTAADGKRVLLAGGRGNATASFEGRSVFSILFASGRWLEAMKFAQRDSKLGGGVPAWKALALELRSRYQTRRNPHRRRERAGAILLSPAFREEQAHLLNKSVDDMRGKQNLIAFATMSSRFCGADTMHTSGVEGRDPFSDRRFIELLLSFPVEAFLAGGRSRGLAREMGAGLVPDAIRLRRNRGAQSPESAGIIQKHADRYRSALDALNDSPACAEAFDLTAASQTLEKLAAGNGNLAEAYSIERLIDAGSLIREWGC